MYDPNDRLTVVRRITDDRMAEARREHLLRAKRGERTSYGTHDLVAGRSLLGRVAAAFHHGTQPTSHRPVFR